MSEETSDPPGVVLSKAEIKKFLSLANSTVDRSEMILADHFQKRIVLSVPLLSRVCELYATGTILLELVEGKIDIESIPEGSGIQMPPTSVQAIAKIILSLSSCKQFLTTNGISLDRNNDV